MKNNNSIYFFLTPMDTVRFILPDKMSAYSSLPYKKFINYVKTNFKINEYQDFMKKLNTYGNTILLMGNTGEWVVRNEDYSEQNMDLPFDELHELNEKNKKPEKTILEKLVDESKKLIKRVHSNRGKQ